MKISVLYKVRAIIHYTLDTCPVRWPLHIHISSYEFVFVLYPAGVSEGNTIPSIVRFEKKKKKEYVSYHAAGLIDPYYPCFRHGLE